MIIERNQIPYINYRAGSNKRKSRSKVICIKSKGEAMTETYCDICGKKCVVKPYDMISGK